MDPDINLLEKLVLDPDKLEAIERFPNNSDLKSSLSLYYSLDSEDFLDRLKSDRNLSQDNKRKLELLHHIHSISNPDSQLKLENLLCPNTHYAPPSELRAKIKSKLPSALDPNKLSIDYGKAAQDVYEFSKLSNNGKMKVKVADMSEKVFNEFIRMGFDCLMSEGIVERLANENLAKKINPLVGLMTLDQMEQLEKLSPTIAFNKDFVLRKIKLQCDFNQMNLREKYFALNNLYESSKVSRIPEFFAAVLANLIFISSQLLNFEKKWIVEYFACHRSSPIYKENNGLQDFILKEFMAVLNQIPTENLLIQDYLDHFLPGIENFEEFLYPMQLTEAKKFFARAKVLAGYNISEFKDFMSESELTALERQPELVILPNNPENFGINETVSLVLRLKRIKHLAVRVIEINGKNFYADTSKLLNFDGLSANYEYFFTYTQPGQSRHNEVFEFPELNKPGIFYVEFMGKGLRTSVIIKKGALKCLFKTTVAGQAITLIDEENQVCDEGGVYLDNNFYPIKNSYVIIPYAPATSTKNLILTNGVIFSLFKFVHLSSNFSLNCGFLFNEEQLVVGYPATIYLTPKVKIFDKDCEDFIITKLECNLMTKDVDGLTSMKNYGKLEYTQEPIPISFNVPPRLRGFALEVVVTIKAGIKEEVLKDRRAYDINTLLCGQDMYNSYFRKNEKGYFLEVRGRNGEPWSNVETLFRLEMKHRKEAVETQLVSDENGVIFLGRLKGVSVVQACTTHTQKFFSLNSYKNSINYPQEIILCEGDKYSLPLLKKPKRPLSSFLVLFELMENNPKRNVSEKFFFDDSTNSIIIQELEKGKYELRFFKKSSSIFITVTDGIHFNNLEYVISENNVSYAPRQFDYFTISTERVENEVQVKTQESLGRAMVYVLFSNFLPPQDFAEELRGIEKMSRPQNWSFERPDNRYFQTSNVSEEYSYIMKRKRQPEFIGNTLPRPQILMKRREEGTTTTESQTAKSVKAEDFRGGLFSGSMNQQARNLKGSSKLNSSNGFCDFLQTPSKWLIFPVSSSYFTIPIDPNYSNLSIFIDNQTCVSSSFISLDSDLHTRDLTVPNTLSPEKTFIELNLSAGVKEGEEFFLTNCENSFEIIDSVEKLFTLLLEVSGSQELGEWRFLGNWGNMDENEKSEKIETFFSHELSLFIYFKDPEYFNKALKPFIQCKMEKGLVDLFLLGESLRKYSGNFEKLNKLEQCLYVLWLAGEKSEEVHRKLKGFKDRAEGFPINSALKNLVYRKIFQATRTSAGPGQQAQPVLSYPPPPPPPQASSSYFLCGASMSHTGPMNAPCAPGSMPPPKPMSYQSASLHQPEFRGSDLLDLYDTSSNFSQFSGGFKTLSSISSRGLKMDEIAQVDLINLLETPSFYKKIDSTKHFNETNYYSKGSCTVNLNHDLHYWTALLGSKTNGQAFLSEFSLFSDSNLASLISVLAFTDLPFTPKPHEFKLVGKTISILAKSNFLIFFKGLSEAPCENSGNILAAHQYFNTVSQKFVSKLTKQTLYECNLVVTNITSESKDLEILQILPVGSIPINPPQSIKNLVVTLPGYSTKVIKYSFYFPTSGDFSFLPACISEKGQIIASASTINPSITDSEELNNITCFLDVVQTGDNKRILEFIQRSNLYVDIQLEKIYFKLNEKEFWASLIQILEEKDYFDDTVLSFSLKYGDIPRSLRYLKENLLVKKALSSMWDEVYEDPPHSEFSPLVNARAYQLGQQKQMANESVLKEYKALLTHLAYKRKLNLTDKLKICQYLLYKDDYSKAKSLFDSFSEHNIQFSTEKLLTGHLQIQLDYLYAYFYPENSQTLVSNYLTYPIPTWRKKFEELHQIFTEVTALHTPETIQVKEHPALSFTIEGSSMKLDYCGLESCTVSFFTLNLEVIFSLNPEMNEDNFNFGYSKPVKEMRLSLGNKGKMEIELPEDLRRKNLFVEVEFAGNKKRQIVYSAEFRYLLFESQGIVKVLDRSGKPKAGIYVKAYAQRAGKLEFYKDGFTDIRGKFDYVSVANSNLQSLQKFSILIIDRQLGELIVNASPPPQ